MKKRLDSVEHEMRREFRKFQRGETKEQRKDLVELMQVQENVEPSFDRLQKNLDVTQSYNDFQINRDIELLQHYVKKYGENFIPGINTEKLKFFEKKIEIANKEKDIVDAEDSLKSLQKNIGGEFAGPFEIHIGKLKGFIEKYGENFVQGITIENLQEMQKRMDLIEAPKMLDGIKSDLEEGRRFGLQKNIKYLEEIIKKYGENFVPGLTYNTLQHATAESLKILGTEQIGAVKKVMNDKIFITPDNGDKDIMIKSSTLNLSEGDKVKFFIKDNDHSFIKELIEE